VSGTIGHVIGYGGRWRVRVPGRFRRTGRGRVLDSPVEPQPPDGSPPDQGEDTAAVQRLPSWDLGSGWSRSEGLDDTAELFLSSDLRLLTAGPPAPSAPPAPPGDSQVWLLDPMAERGPDLLSRLGERRLEVVALLALTAGTMLFSFAGLLLGFVLLTLSRLWDLRDKLLTVLVLPGATVFGGIVLAWLRATRIDPVPEAGQRLDRALDSMATTVQAIPLLVGWLAAAYLTYLLVRDADRSS
jgi:hypothetical protein